MLHTFEFLILLQNKPRWYRIRRRSTTSIRATRAAVILAVCRLVLAALLCQWLKQFETRNERFDSV